MKRCCRKNTKHSRIKLGIILALLVVLGCLWWFSLSHMDLTITRYQIETEKLGSDWKVALLSDLHNQEYGEDNSLLIQEIEDYAPDAILLCGDMINMDDTDVSVALTLCQALAEIADVYYIYGNHEGYLQYDPNGPQLPLDRYLMDLGITVLYSGLYELTHEGDTITLLSKSIHAEEYRDNKKSQKQVAEFLEQETFKLAMSHFPDLFYDALYDADFDLAVAGHYHGGQIILPGVGGLYHGDTGFFPEYYGGAYQLGRGTLILSRGLGNGTLIPRINNDPELVFIDIIAK